MNWREWLTPRLEAARREEKLRRELESKRVTFENFDPPRDLTYVPDDEWTSCARPELNKGDTVTVIAGGQQHRFRVTDVRQDGATTVASVEPYDWRVDGL